MHFNDSIQEKSYFETIRILLQNTYYYIWPLKLPILLTYLCPYILSVLLQGIQLEWKVPVWNNTFTSFVCEHAHVEQNRKTNMEDDDKLLCGGESRKVQDESKFFCHYFGIYRANQSSVTRAVSKCWHCFLLIKQSCRHDCFCSFESEHYVWEIPPKI